tara:strand:+ start:68 stop:316 length:249 start_codon:yes stop_codon:yes gene_type:complete
MSEFKEGARQIVKAAMYDELLEKYKKLLVDYDILKAKHEEASKLFKDYRGLVQKRADEFRKVIDGVIQDRSSEKPFSKDDLS